MSTAQVFRVKKEGGLISLAASYRKLTLRDRFTIYLGDGCKTSALARDQSICNFKMQTVSTLHQLQVVVRKLKQELDGLRSEHDIHLKAREGIFDDCHWLVRTAFKVLRYIVQHLRLWGTSPAAKALDFSMPPDLAAPLNPGLIGRIPHSLTHTQFSLHAGLDEEGHLVIRLNSQVSADSASFTVFQYAKPQVPSTEITRIMTIGNIKFSAQSDPSSIPSLGPSLIVAIMQLFATSQEDISKSLLVVQAGSGARSLSRWNCRRLLSLSGFGRVPYKNDYTIYCDADQVFRPSITSKDKSFVNQLWDVKYTWKRNGQLERHGHLSRGFPIFYPGSFKYPLSDPSEAGPA